MGTASESWGRFPVSRERLNAFRAAGRDKEELNVPGDEQEEGVTETSESAKEKIARKTGDDNGEEKERSYHGTPETRSPKASHDPGGSWLTKVARQEKCTTAAQQTSPISVGQQVCIRNFERRWRDSKFEGPYFVTQSTPTAVKLEGRKPWIHLSDVRLALASCHISPSSQELLKEDKEKEEGQRPS
ncbi:hypothetical protein NDU88_005968 [Pleurodeles waltl]|uniref:Murine leukemia virus integrase C-terminal domain-containing protein n=1 Tax=Pleurodeles waltl TaxID=8319 RepID=A0AAV7MG81_PLEWA|nr:hypothetical protein NDU88_005968 [Pleurodeles waltl]